MIMFDLNQVSRRLSGIPIPIRMVWELLTWEVEAETVESPQAKCQDDRNAAGTVTTWLGLWRRVQLSMIYIALSSLNIDAMFFKVGSALAWAVTNKILLFTYCWRVFSFRFFNSLKIIYILMMFMTVKAYSGNAEADQYISRLITAEPFTTYDAINLNHLIKDIDKD